MLIQEHWLRETQFHRIKSIPYADAMILSHDVSAINDSVFSQGRGFGGVSILWKNSLNAKVTPIVVSSNRICAVSVCVESFECILINVYIPCDSSSNLNEYVHVWEDILSICEQAQTSNIIIGGDLNTSMYRNSQHTQYLLNLLNEEQFHICDRE